MSNPKWDSLQMTLLFILPSQHLPNQRFSRKMLTTLHAGVINGTCNLQVIHITRSKNPIPTQYTLHNYILESVSSAKYLRVDISAYLSWDTHINRISKKANNTLCFLRRNFKIHPGSLNTYVYKVLVRPQFEYCSTVWCPFTDSNISKLEAAQRRAARWVKMTMNRLPVSQKWCSPDIGIGSTNGE